MCVCVHAGSQEARDRNRIDEGSLAVWRAGEKDSPANKTLFSQSNLAIYVRIKSWFVCWHTPALLLVCYSPATYYIGLRGTLIGTPQIRRFVF